MNPICNEPHLYEYFRTPEEKRAAKPKLKTDEVNEGANWHSVYNDGNFDENGRLIYRRKRKALFGWVDVKDALPQDDRLYIYENVDHRVSWSYGYYIREKNPEMLRWLNYPDPPSPLPTPEQVEEKRFTDWLNAEYKPQDSPTAKAAWMARAKLDRKDKE